MVSEETFEVVVFWPLTLKKVSLKIIYRYFQLSLKIIYRHFQPRQQLYKSRCVSFSSAILLCLPATSYRSLMLLVVYISCQYYCSLYYQIILQSYFAISAAIAALQVAMSVSLSVCPQRVLFCYQCIIVVIVVVVNNIRTFCYHILHFQLQQYLYKS